MYDATQRALWLEQLDAAVSKAFGLPQRKYNWQVGYSASGGRGRLDKIRPADVADGPAWQGNENESDGLATIHPIAFREGALGVAKAMLWARSRKERGIRHGAKQVGLTKNHDATIDADSETETRLNACIAEVGQPPEGFGDPFPVKKVHRGRMVPYFCGGQACPKVYCTSAKLSATCDTCSGQFLKL